MSALVFIVIATSMVTLLAHGGEPTSVTMVAVAVYSPQDRHDGSRVYGILREHDILAVGTESASVSVSVSSTDAARARALLSEAVRREHLRVMVLAEDKPK